MNRKIRGAADLIEYQRELVRTHDYEPLGRAQKISIGPSATWDPLRFREDPFIRMYGRYIDLRRRFLPLAQSRDHQMVLICAPVIREDGAVGLPDVPDPAFTPADWTPDEVTRVVARDPAKDRAPMIAQRMTDRCEQIDGKPAVLPGTNFLVFQPVLRVAFQPEIKNRLVADAWILEFRPDGDKHASLLIDHKTGEAFFLYGKHDIQTPAIGHAGMERWDEGQDAGALKEAAQAAMAAARK